METLPHRPGILLVAMAALLAWPHDSLAQSQRRLTTIDALRQFPGYYHLQTVVLRGEFVEHESQIVLRSDLSDLKLLNPSQARKGAVEVRGQVIDLGRLEPDDARLGDYVKRRGIDQWPRPGMELLLNITGVMEAQLAVQPTVRSVALEPWRFEGQKVTLVGNFRGRNLFGDLPDAPGKGRYDFVLGGAEGAVWVVGIRPRGQGFDLDVDRRADSNRWLQVTGVVNRLRGLVTVTATGIALTKAPQAPTVEPETSSGPVLVQPVTVVFSAPTGEETDVPTTTAVRVQFSRGLREATLEGRVRVAYVGAASDDPPLQFKMTYDAALRAVQIAFSRPLEPFRTVKVDLLEGLTAFDGAPVVPWSMTFSVGAR
jgi:hypothetical protein